MNTKIPAGEFSEWLHGVGRDADVPCGDCNACCRASMFIHIEPKEKAVDRIPRPLLFDAPGRPKGHLVMGYNEHGHCPMLVEQKCSVYDARPRTCRRYDCRIFAATGIDVDPALPEIAQRSEAWEFTYATPQSRHEQELVLAAAAFLMDKYDQFPQGSLPSHPAPLAALALSIYKLFAEEKPDTELVASILQEAGSL